MADQMEFNLPDSIAAKRRILMQHERRSVEKLAAAREIAVEIALKRPDRTVMADAVHEEFDKRYGPGLWNKWAGSLFKDGNWTPVGFAPSPVVAYHANMRRQWRLERESASAGVAVGEPAQEC